MPGIPRVHNLLTQTTKALVTTLLGYVGLQESCIPWNSNDYFLNGFSVNTIVLVGIYNQQFKGTILLYSFYGLWLPGYILKNIYIHQSRANPKVIWKSISPWKKVCNNKGASFLVEAEALFVFTGAKLQKWILRFVSLSSELWLIIQNPPVIPGEYVGVWNP